MSTAISKANSTEINTQNRAQICIDATFVLQWIIPAPRSEAADSLLQKWDENGIHIISPPLLDVDITAFISKLVQMKLLLPQQGEQAFQNYRQIGIDIINPPSLTQAAWELTGKFDQANIPDLYYLALAELLNTDFWTANRRLFSNLSGKSERAHFLGDIAAAAPVVIPPLEGKKADSHKATRSDFPGLWRAI